MAQAPAKLPYDASRAALYTPERSEPPADFGIAWNIDRICAELSRLAYYHFELAEGPRLDAALARAGFSPAATFNFAPAGAQAFATTMPDGTGLVAFRGTQPGDLRDLIADARANLVEFQNGARVHAGFLAAFRSLEQPIADWIARTGSPRLVFTGHSLGAAMATVAAALRPDSRLVTFGSPRVGDPAFAAPFAAREVRRYVDCTDCITRVPPELLGYGHAGADLYIDRFGKVHEPGPPAPAIAEDRRLGRRSFALRHAWKVWRNVLVRDIADHAPVNYVSAVLGRREGG
jgi:hypothetical protein